MKAWSPDTPLSPAVFQVAACQHLCHVRPNSVLVGAVEVSSQLPLVEAPSSGAAPLKRDLKCYGKFHSHLAAIVSCETSLKGWWICLFFSCKWAILIARFIEAILCLDTPAAPVQLLAQSKSWPMLHSLRSYSLLNFRYLCPCHSSTLQFGPSIKIPLNPSETTALFATCPTCWSRLSRSWIS